MLLFVENDAVRNAIHEALGDAKNVRARDLKRALALAEQEEVRAIVLWTPPTASAALYDTIGELRRRRPMARLIVVAPKLTPVLEAMMDVVRPSALLLDSAVEAIALAATRGLTRERRRASPTGIAAVTVTGPTSRGSSAGGH